jgi:hypothetical protein
MMFQIYVGSLAATYYQNTDFTSPTSSPPSGVSGVNLCPGTRCRSRPQSSALEKYTPFSLRFEGMVKPDIAGTYTFLAEVENADDRVKLWVSNNLVIDAWESLSSLSPMATWVFSEGIYADVKIEYKTTETCVYPYNCYDLKLKWDYSGSSTVIPSRNLLQRSNFSQVPLVLRISPSLDDARMSTATGLGLSLSTVGVPSKFTVTARDAYSNVVGQGGSLFVATLGNPPTNTPDSGKASSQALLVRPNVAVTVPLNFSRYPLQLSITSSGDQHVSIQSAAVGGIHTYVFDNNQFLGSPVISFISPEILISDKDVNLPRAFSVRWSGFIRPRAFLTSGLWATYYLKNNSGSSSHFYPVAAAPSFSLNFKDDVSPVPSCFNGSYQVLWTGLLRPTRAQRYTIHAAKNEAKERVMVWVDHNLVIDMWSSLNVNNEMSGFTEFGQAGGYYNIKVLYAADTVGQGIELKWETEGQTKDLMASALFSGNEDPAGTTEYLFKTIPADGCRVTVGSSVVLDTGSLLPYSSPLHLLPDAWYTIEMQYADVKDIWTAKLLWAVSGSEFESIPSSHLMYSLAHIHASPFSTYVVAARASADRSRYTAPLDERIQVGSEFSVDVLALDEYGNKVVGGYESFLAFVSYPTATRFSSSSRRLVTADKMDIIQPMPYAMYNRYSKSFVMTRAGSATLSVKLLYASGISATYFSGADLRPSAAVKSSILASIDFSAPPFKSPHASSLPSNVTYSVRWAGMLRPISNHTNTIQASKQALEERVKVWVDNELLIDAWSSLGLSKEMSGTLGFKGPGSNFDILIEYAAGEPHQNGSGLTLSWLSTNISVTDTLSSVINSSELVAAASVPTISSIPNISYSNAVEFRSSHCNLHSSVARGSGICIATVGEISRFTVVARDMYGNEIENESLHTLEVHGSSKTPVTGRTAWNGSEYHVAYEATHQGSLKLIVHMQCANSSQEIPQSPLSVRVEQAENFDASKSECTSSSSNVITAGVPAVFRIHLRDRYGSPWYSKRARLMADLNGKRIFHYVSAILNKGILVAVASSTSFYLHAADHATSFAQTCSEFVGRFIATDVELRVIESCIGSTENAHPLITISQPFSNMPRQGDNYKIYSSTDPEPLQSENYIDISTTWIYTMNVKQAVGLGLQGAYFLGNFGTELFSRIDGEVNFDWNVLSPMKEYFPAFQAGGAFTSRWTGYVYSSIAQEHTFYVDLAGSDERIKLWIDTNLVIDQWSSLAGIVKGIALDQNCIDREGQMEICRCACNQTTVSCYPITSCWGGSCDCRWTIEPSGVSLLDSWMMHSLVLEYKNSADSSSIALQWSTNGPGGNIQQQVIPKSFFSPSAVHLSGSPFQARVDPGDLSFKHSSTWAKLTLLTAGVSHHFSLIARDAFGNLRNFDYRHTQLVSRLIYEDSQDKSRIPAVHATLIHNSSMVQGQFVFEITSNISTSSVPLITSLVSAGGIAATYFSGTDLRSSTAVKAAILPTLDFSSAPFHAPAASMPASSSYSIRWAGMLRPLYADTYTMYANWQGPEGRVKMWIDNLLLIDQWSSIDRNDLSSTITFSAAGAYFDIKVEYKSDWHNSTANASNGFKLRWKSVQESLDVVPVRALHQEHRIGDPILVSVLTSTVCSSLVTMSGPSLMTAGVHATFRILLRDQFYNVITQTSQGLAGTIFRGETADGATKPWALKSGQYTEDERCAILAAVTLPDEHSLVPLTVATKLAGPHQLNIALVSRGGLLGAYHNACVPSVSKTVLQRVDPVISFEWDESLAKIADLDSSEFSVQWQGFIRVPGDDTYTFSVVSNGAVQLGVNGIRVVDFTANVEARRDGSLYLISDRLYKVDIRFSTRTKDSYLQIRWRSRAYVQDQVLPSDRLYHTHQPLAVSPSQSSILVLPAPACASRSYMTGVALTLSTAGLSSTFAIISRDEHGNLRREKEDRFIVKMSTPAGRSMDLKVALDWEQWRHVVTYVQTVAGSQLIDAYLLGGTGLQSTYYIGAGQVFADTGIAGHMPGANIDFSSRGRERFHGLSLSAQDLFSVRWHGFILFPYAQEYEFSTILANNSDRVRMWIDNQLVVDQWTSLDTSEPSANYTAVSQENGLGSNISLQVEYRHVQGDAGLKLKWATSKFEQKIEGTCRELGLSPIAAKHYCIAAAIALAYPRVKIDAIREIYWPPWPTGCVWQTSTASLIYNSAPDLEVCSEDYRCLCAGHITNQVVSPDKLVQADKVSSDMLTFVEGGLHATFYNYPDLTAQKATVQARTVDFSSPACSHIECVVDDWHPGVSVKRFTDDDHVSARWVGFLKAPYPQTFTFAASLLENDERVKVWVDNALIIDMWDSLSAIVPSQAASFRCSDSEFTPLKIEYKDISGAQGLKLSWESIEMAIIPRECIPSSALAMGVQRKELPIAFENQPDSFCSVTSIPFGSSLSVSSAGTTSTFRVLARDQFGNFRPVADADVSNLLISQVSYDWREWTVDEGITLSSRGDVVISQDTRSYLSSYRAITRAGQAVLFAAFANLGGLAATFYDDERFSSTAAVKAVAPYAYSSLFILAGANDVPGTAQGTQPPMASEGGYSISLTESTEYTVRFNGFIKPKFSGVYSVWLGFGIARGDRARLWIDNRVIIDEWESMGAEFQDGSAFDVKLLLEVGATVHFRDPEEFYQIQIEYKHSTGPQMLSLMWAHPEHGLERSYIQTGRLAWALNSQGAPWPIINRPAATCASSSFAQGTDITISTAGRQHTFTIFSKDQFGNSKDQGGDLYVVRIYSCCGPEITTGSLRDTGNGKYSVSFTALTRSGSNTVFAVLLASGGLASTFYDDPQMTLPRETQVDPVVSFYSALGRTPTILSTYDIFGARWTGFIMATRTGLYTFRTVIGGDDERVKLWIDNKMIIDHWSSLITLTPQGTMYINSNVSNWYAVELKYRQYAGTARIELEWSAPSLSNTLIPRENLYQSDAISGFYIPSYNNPARTSSAKTEAFGVGLTLAKVCADASFTITARDSFNNLLTADQAEWYVRLTNAPNRMYANLEDSFTLPGNTAWDRNSRYIASYIAQGSGNWNFISLLEGPHLSATYYNGPNLNASTASTSLLQENIDFSSVCQVCSSLPCHCTLPDGVWIDGRTYCDEPGFSVRWAGFITPPDLGQYGVTFKLRTRTQTDEEGRNGPGSDERVRLWIDNKIVFDQWDSLSSGTMTADVLFEREGIHDFKMEYSKEPHPNTAQYGQDWKLTWIYRSSDVAVEDVIPSSVFTHGNDILRQPYQYFVDPPMVQYANPLNGPPVGSTPISIFGQNFGEKGAEICKRTVYLGSTGVDTFDGQVLWSSSSTVVAFSPPGVGCCHNITLELVGMKSLETGYARYSYDAPVVTAVRLGNAAATGMGMITVIGGNFGGIDYSPRSRVGGSACITTLWLSDSMLECAVPTGNNDSDDPDMSILVTVGNQIMKPGGTFTRAFTYDEPNIEGIEPVNTPLAGGVNITVVGYAIAPTYDPSPESRIGGTATENTLWLSQSSVQCRVSKGAAKDKGAVISLEMHLDTTSSVFSFDAPALEATAYNQPPSFNHTIITINGLNFAFEDRTSRARIAHSDSNEYITDEHFKNRGTATVLTTWISNTAVRCMAATGLQATQSIVITTGMLVSKLQGQISEVFTYDLGQVSGAQPRSMAGAGSSSYVTYLGSCELGTAGGFYSSKFIAEFICDQAMNLGVCATSSCPCLGVYEDPASSLWRLCYRLNWNGTLALPLSMCDGVVEGQMAPNGVLTCSMIAVHVRHVESYCVGCEFCHYVTNAMLLMGLNFGLWDTTPKTRLGSSAYISTVWLSDSSLQLLAPPGLALSHYTYFILCALNLTLTTPGST